MWPRFEQSLARHQELEQQLADPAVIGDRARYAQLAKEHGTLTKVVKPYLEYKNLTEEIKQNEAILAASIREIQGTAGQCENGVCTV